MKQEIKEELKKRAESKRIEDIIIILFAKTWEAVAKDKTLKTEIKK